MQEIRLTDPRAIMYLDVFAQRRGITDLGTAAAILINLVADVADGFRRAPESPLVEQEDFGRAVKEARMRSALSQRELSRLAHVALDTIHRTETGKNDFITSSVAKALAAAMPEYTDQLMVILANQMTAPRADKESAA